MEGTWAVGWANMLYITPTLILIAGVVDDLKSQKVHNWLVLVLLILASIDTFSLQGLEGLKIGVLAALTTLGIFLPLVALKIVGAGDMKLMLAFAVTSSPQVIGWMTLYSLIWGAVFGIFKVLISNKFTQFYVNMTALINKDVIDKKELTKIPFTIALFLGWLTYLSLKEGIL